MSHGVVLAAALEALLLPGATSGIEINHSWSALAATVKPGRQIAATRMNSDSRKGKLLSIDDHSVTIQQWSGNQTIPRADVLRARGVRAGRRVVLGTLIVACSGSVILWAIDRGSKQPRADERKAFAGLLTGVNWRGGSAWPGRLVPCWG